MKKSTLYSQKWQRDNPWKHKYIQAKSNAKLRGISFLLTFEEWCLFWRESGKWEQRGWRRGQYCMARFGDKGAYEIGNVKICLAEENRAERNQNYPMRGERNPAHGKDYWASAGDQARDRRAAETSKRMKGVPKSPEHREKIRAGLIRYAIGVANGCASS